MASMGRPTDHYHQHRRVLAAADLVAMGGIKVIMIHWLIRILLYAAPKPDIGDGQRAEFEALLDKLEQSSDPLIIYDLPYPKWQFIHYLSLQGRWVFHGSNHTEIETFEPREQTLYNNERARAVFASTDPIWPFFYAVFRRDRLIGSFRNGCIVQGN